MITWLHLSDFHFSKDKNRRWDEQIVLKALLDDVKAQRDEHGAFDFIVISGDVAFSGSKVEYESAGKFLDALLEMSGTSKDRLLIVPGNHDGDRDAIGFAERAVAGAIKDRKNLAEVMTSEASRRPILRRQDAYRSFVEQYVYGPAVPTDDTLFVIRRISKSEVTIALIGINSAFLSEGEEKDRAKMALYERQVREALDQTSIVPRSYLDRTSIVPLPGLRMRTSAEVPRLYIFQDYE